MLSKQKEKRVIRNPEKVTSSDKTESGDLTNREISARNQAIIDSKNSNLSLPKTDPENITDATKGERSKIKEEDDIRSAKKFSIMQMSPFHKKWTEVRKIKEI